MSRFQYKSTELLWNHNLNNWIRTYYLSELQQKKQTHLENPEHFRLMYLNLAKETPPKLVVHLPTLYSQPNCFQNNIHTYHCLYGCDITDKGCVALSSALRSNPSHLRELDLSDNKLPDSGVKLISDVLKNPDCKLKKLKLRWCNITDEGCVSLTSALRSNPSHLTHLNLSNNYSLRDSGVKRISDVLKNPDCKLEILWLCKCDITDEGCVALTSALRSNPSHLTHLDLSHNKLTDSGVKLISDLKDDPHYKLETVR
ncbi:ribonuclease inhibitor-like [Misgurnus anguillicaudatus]|uniref:ribonuclease inhibitor-like n=1 Tax=Misgurnus anguillicaudatus TaxID=75329 RepID=UPI003CCF0A5D